MSLNHLPTAAAFLFSAAVLVASPCLAQDDGTSSASTSEINGCDVSTLPTILALPPPYILFLTTGAFAVLFEYLIVPLLSPVMEALKRCLGCCFAGCNECCMKCLEPCVKKMQECWDNCTAKLSACKDKVKDACTCGCCPECCCPKPLTEAEQKKKEREEQKKKEAEEFNLDTWTNNVWTTIGKTGSIAFSIYAAVHSASAATRMNGFYDWCCTFCYIIFNSGALGSIASVIFGQHLDQECDGDVKKFFKKLCRGAVRYVVGYPLGFMFSICLFPVMILYIWVFALAAAIGMGIVYVSNDADQLEMIMHVPMDEFLSWCERANESAKRAKEYDAENKRRGVYGPAGKPTGGAAICSLIERLLALSFGSFFCLLALLGSMGKSSDFFIHLSDALRTDERDKARKQRLEHAATGATSSSSSSSSKKKPNSSSTTANREEEKELEQPLNADAGVPVEVTSGADDEEGDSGSKAACCCCADGCCECAGNCGKERWKYLLFAVLTGAYTKVFSTLIFSWLANFAVMWLSSYNTGSPNYIGVFGQDYSARKWECYVDNLKSTASGTLEKARLDSSAAHMPGLNRIWSLLSMLAN